MQLLSLTFLLVVLPLGLFVHHALPLRFRPVFLLAFSLVCFFAAQPWSLTLMLSTVLLDYLALQLMHRFAENQRARRGVLLFSVVKNLTVVLYAGSVAGAGQVQAVLGVMVYTLLGADCVVSVYRREVDGPQDPVAFGLYTCFFPRLVAGPFQPYPQFRQALDKGLPTDGGQMLRGLGLLLGGALKVLLLARYLSALVVSLGAQPAAEASVLASWLLALSLALLTFYRISGYCDVARGIGMLFGLELPQSFYYPYQSRGMGDFFQRFHSTLWQFWQRMLREVPGEESGENTGAAAGIFSLVVLGMLFGMWFGLQLQYLLWGGFLALFMAVERHFLHRLPLRLPVLLQRGYTLVVVLLSFALVAGNTLQEGLRHFANLFFPPSVPLAGSQVLYLLSANWLLLAIGLVFATNGANLLGTILQKQFPRVARVGAAVGNGAMLVIVVALLV